jgi:hypothetical protein
MCGDLRMADADHREYCVGDLTQWEQALELGVVTQDSLRLVVGYGFGLGARRSIVPSLRYRSGRRQRKFQSNAIIGSHLDGGSVGERS